VSLFYLGPDCINNIPSRSVLLSLNKMEYLGSTVALAVIIAGRDRSESLAYHRGDVS
jgi:hypothetical protein